MAGPVGVALFGLGRAGSIHLGNLIANPRVKLMYIVEEDEPKARDVIDRYRLGARVLREETQAEVFQNPDVHAVVVCTPTFTHEGITRQALQHGKAVFCEKPLSDDLEGMEGCYQAADAAGKPLFCSFNRRFDPSVRSLRDRVKSGELGTLYTVRTCSRDHPRPSVEYLRVSGGMYHDCAVHDIDMVCWILEEYPTSVFTTAHAHNKDIAGMNDVDTAIVVMKFASGIVATIEMSRNASYGYDQRLEVFGSDGMLVSENQRPTELTAFSKDGSKQPAMKYSFPQRYRESYILALEHFLDAVQNGQNVEITKDETLTVCRIASACEESLKSGVPVNLTY